MIATSKNVIESARPIGQCRQLESDVERRLSVVRSVFEVFYKGEKAAVLKLLEQLPKEAIFEDIQYRLYVPKKSGSGMTRLMTDRLLHTSDVMRELAGWLA